MTHGDKNCQKRKILMAYISVSKMLLEGSFPKRKFLFRKFLMDYISNSKMPLAEISQKGNYMLENSEKCQKNPKKYWKNSHGFGKCPKFQINSRNIQINCFSGWKNPENFWKNCKKIQNVYKYFIKFSLMVSIH